MLSHSQVPNIVTKSHIGGCAFADNGLEKFAIPAGVESVGSMAVCGENLHAVYVLGAKTELAGDAFYSTGGTFACTVYGYRGSTAETYARNFDFGMQFAALD